MIVIELSMQGEHKVTHWLDKSLAAMRGLGWAKSPRTHELTEAKQGVYHYTIGPYSSEVLRIAPGDRVIVETKGCL